MTLHCKHKQYKIKDMSNGKYKAYCQFCSTHGKACVTGKQAVKSLRHTPQWFM